MWRKRVEYENKNADRLEKNLARRTLKAEGRDSDAPPRLWTDDDKLQLKAAVLAHGAGAWCVACRAAVVAFGILVAAAVHAVCALALPLQGRNHA